MKFCSRCANKPLEAGTIYSAISRIHPSLYPDPKYMSNYNQPINIHLYARFFKQPQISFFCRVRKYFHYILCEGVIGPLLQLGMAQYSVARISRLVDMYHGKVSKKLIYLLVFFFYFIGFD